MVVHSFTSNSETAMKKGLKRFGVIILAVLATAAILDLVVGKTIDKMLPQISNIGNVGKTYFSLNEVNASVVIVGSSRAAHHYETEMIEDSLGMPAYNVGRDGCFFSYNCCVVNSILDRYSPELIIWENGRDYLSKLERDPIEAIYPYYKTNRWATEIIEKESSWSERIRLCSRSYRYNSTVHQIIRAFITRHKFKVETLKGYLPLSPKNLREPIELKREPIEGEELNQVNIDLFRATLNRAKSKGVKMVVVDSPEYRIRNDKCLSMETMLNICNEYGIIFINNSQSSYFLDNPELFDDAMHLNDDGAKVYTSLFLSQIKDYVEYE